MYHSPHITEAASAADPMIAFAAAWREEEASVPVEDGNVPDNWPRPLDELLRAGSLPVPTTIAGAAEAIRMAAQEAREGMADPVITTLLEVALMFFDDSPSAAPPLCPGAVIADVIAAHIDDHEATEAAGMETSQGSWQRDYYDRVETELDNGISALRDALAYVQAISPKGALAQVSVISALVSWMSGMEDVETRKSLALSVDNLAHSVANFLDGQAGASRDHAVPTYFFPRTASRVHGRQAPEELASAS